jgi:transposase-like protein
MARGETTNMRLAMQELREGRTMRQIAQKWGITAQSMRRAAKRNGIIIRPEQEWAYGRKKKGERHVES